MELTFIERNIEQSVIPRSDDGWRESESCALNTAGQCGVPYILDDFSKMPYLANNFRHAISVRRSFLLDV